LHGLAMLSERNGTCVMNGKRFLLDTNALVQVLAGNAALLQLLVDAELIATSIICELEFLAFPNLTDADRDLLSKFLQRIDVVDLLHADNQLTTTICEIRATKKLKLPDAIIAASAMHTNCTLVTADQKLLQTPGLATMSFPLI